MKHVQIHDQGSLYLSCLMANICSFYYPQQTAFPFCRRPGAQLKHLKSCLKMKPWKSDDSKCTIISFHFHTWNFPKLGKLESLRHRSSHLKQPQTTTSIAHDCPVSVSISEPDESLSFQLRTRRSSTSTSHIHPHPSWMVPQSSYVSRPTWMISGKYNSTVIWEYFLICLPEKSPFCFLLLWFLDTYICYITGPWEKHVR